VGAKEQIPASLEETEERIETDVTGGGRVRRKEEGYGVRVKSQFKYAGSLRLIEITS